MKYRMEFSLKKYQSIWSDQKIEGMFEGVEYKIDIYNEACAMELIGNDLSSIEELCRILWEILSLYDGYFYMPTMCKIDNVEKDIGDLYKRYYKTSQIWIDNAELLGRNQRCITEEIINTYRRFRNLGRDNQKMSKSMINAYYFVKSESYEKINVEHTLSLFLNLCDGFIINVYGDSGAMKDKIKKAFRLIDRETMKKGLKCVGIEDVDNLYFMLGEYRHEIDHYKYKEGSISSYAKNVGVPMTFIDWYLTYFTELALRTAILNYIGYEVKEEVKSYAAQGIVSWLIFKSMQW
ncbi:MAG: hypothetical protein K2G20_03060 [Lachnospiraceae bacterium]|nr:hypothetical protein [Lachnospiraceae bacterium]